MTEERVNQDILVRKLLDVENFKIWLKERDYGEADEEASVYSLSDFIIQMIDEYTGDAVCWSCIAECDD
jgi:hypothetical protein